VVHRSRDHVGGGTTYIGSLNIALGCHLVDHHLLVVPWISQHCSLGVSVLRVSIHHWNSWLLLLLGKLLRHHFVK